MNHLLKVLQGETLQGCRVSPWSRGFTLIELLVVIAILGILSAGILTAINVTSNLDKARIAKAKTFSKSLENSLSVSQVGKWSFEGTADDTSGYGNNGTLRNGATTSTNHCDLGFGKCLNLDGVDDYVNVPNNPNLNIVNAITVSAWIKLNKYPNNAYQIISKGSTTTDSMVQWYIGSSINVGEGKVLFIATIGGTWTGGNQESKIPLNQWAHAVATYDGSKTVNYLNGVPSSPTSASGDLATNTIDLKIGTGINGESINGLIDEVAIYKEALTASQIHQLYAQGLAKHPLAKR